MKHAHKNHPGDSAPQDQPDENVRSRGGQKLRGTVKNPGGGGSQERIPAKGNDLTHEEDLLDSDIANEVDNTRDEDEENR
jgi:hypothetical protein